MNCPRCNGKCKVVQTHKNNEAKIEKVYVEAGLGKKEKKSLSDYEMVEKNVVNSVPIVRRKQHCPNCKCYFWTKEIFEGYTEDTIRSGLMDKIQDRFNNIKEEDFKDMVFCELPEVKEVKTELKIKLTGIRGGQ